MLGGEELPSTSGVQLSASYRWSYSDRHFSGDHENRERQREGSEVINDSHFFELGVTYPFTPRFSATLSVPYSFHDRSSTVRGPEPERKVIRRYHTQAEGLGDLRLVGNVWLLDPTNHPKGVLLRQVNYLLCECLRGQGEFVFCRIAPQVEGP
ncbi:MAG: hypothetical protein ACR2OZ_21135 [Verrucomicrobiales bacterium]